MRVNECVCVCDVACSIHGWVCYGMEWNAVEQLHAEDMYNSIICLFYADSLYMKAVYAYCRMCSYCLCAECVRYV